MSYPYTLKDIARITGKSNQSLFNFIKENREFINSHSQRNKRFVKYDEDALQAFINKFGRIDSETLAEDPSKQAQIAPSDAVQSEVQNPPQEVPQSVIEAFEAQIKALTDERDELAKRLSNREEDCKQWRDQAGQALSALSKEQERVEKLEERLAGYLPAPTNAPNSAEKPKRKLTLRERLTGHINS